MKMRLSFTLFVLFCTNVFAQNQTEQAINFQQQKLEQEEKNQEIEKAQKERIKLEETKTQIETKEDANCFEIAKINIEGNESILKISIKKVTKKYTNKCLGVNKINDLTKELTNLYIAKGFVTSRVFAKQPQDLSDNILDLVAIEGKLEEITRSDTIAYKILGINLKKQTEKPHNVLTSHPLQTGKTLNLRHLEQGLEQINRLSSNGATMKILPSKKQGFSSVEILNKKTRNLTFIGISYNNFGFDSIQRNSIAANINLEDFLGLNESFYGQISKSFTPQANFQNDRNARRYNDNFYISSSIPLGNFNFDHTFSNANFSIPITLSNGDIFYSFGETKTHNLKGKRVFFRNNKIKFATELSLTHKNIQNFTQVRDLTTKSAIGSRKITTVKFGLNNNFYIKNGLFIFNPAVIHGLNWLGALNDATSNQSQSAQYTAFTLYSYFTKNIWKLNYTITSSGIYSNQELFGSEQQFIGGAYSVRGFRNVSVGGEKSFFVRNDLKFDLKHISNYLKNFNITPFLDYGHAKTNFMQKEEYNMAGTGLKLGFASKMFDADFTYARGIYASKNLQNEWLSKDGKNIFYLNFDLKL